MASCRLIAIQGTPEMTSKLPAFFLLFLLALTFIFSFDYALSAFIFHAVMPYDQKRILEVFLLSLSAVIFLFAPSLREKIIFMLDNMHTRTKIALYAFLYFGLLSALFSKIPMAGFLEWSLDILLIFFALGFAAIALQLGERFYFLLCGIIFLVIAAYVYPVIDSYSDSIAHHADIYFFPNFINKRFFSQFVSMTLALLPLLDIRLSSNKRFILLRVILFLLAGFWWGLIIINGSRGVFIAFLIMTIVGCLLFRKIILPWLWRQALFILVGIAFVSVFAGSHFTVQSHAAILTNITHIKNFNEITLESRIVLYRYALLLAMHHPLLGVGPMHFAFQEPAMLIQADDLAAHPHNFLLLFLSEWGILAFILLLFFIIKILFHFVRTIDRTSIIYAAFSMSLGCGLLDALVSGVFVMPLSQLLFATIAGSCVALYFQRSGILIISRHSILYWLGMLSVIGFAIYITLHAVTTQMPFLQQNEIFWLEKHGFNTELNPRFWLQGWLH